MQMLGLLVSAFVVSVAVSAGWHTGSALVSFLAGARESREAKASRLARQEISKPRRQGDELAPDPDAGA